MIEVTTVTMIERVARAILQARYYDVEPEAYRGSLDTFFRFLSSETYDEAMVEARAAIAAMREPTDAVAEAVWAETGDPCWKENAIEAWQAGVDAALRT